MPGGSNQIIAQHSNSVYATAEPHPRDHGMVSETENVCLYRDDATMSLTIALIADIHGNLTALDAVLDALKAEPPDQIVCLGDVAATGPHPRQVLRRLRELGCPVVMGNADAELLDVAPPGLETDEDHRRIADISRWCAAQLDDADRAFLASFQPTVEIPLGEERSLLCCHGSPRSYDDIIVAMTSEDEIDTMIAAHEATVFAGGHTHI